MHYPVSWLNTCHIIKRVLLRTKPLVSHRRDLAVRKQSPVTVALEPKWIIPIGLLVQVWGFQVLWLLLLETDFQSTLRGIDNFPCCTWWALAPPLSLEQYCSSSWRECSPLSLSLSLSRAIRTGTFVTKIGYFRNFGNFRNIDRELLSRS